MATTNLSNEAIDLYLDGVKIKRLILNGVELYSKPEEGDPEQEWDTNVPTKTDYVNLTELPVDALSIKGGICAIEVSPREFVRVEPGIEPKLEDAMKLTGGINNIQVSKRQFQYVQPNLQPELMEGLQLTGGIALIELVNHDL